MSFVTWKAGYIATNDREPGPFDSFYGGQAESQAQIAALKSERDVLKQRIEQLEVQMAGITTVALGWGIKESEILEKGAWAWSVPYQDVLDLRRKYDALSTPASGGERVR